MTTTSKHSRSQMTTKTSPTDMKPDRKIMARKQLLKTLKSAEHVHKRTQRKSVAKFELLKTLTTAHHLQATNVMQSKQELKYNTHFPASSGVYENPYFSVTSENTLRAKYPEELKKDVRNLFTRDFGINKMHEVLENWNDFFLELHSDHNKKQLQNVQAPFTDFSDLPADIPSPWSTECSNFASNNKKDSYFDTVNSNQDIVKECVCEQARTRSQMSSILEKLNKEELPTREKTQQWVNKLPSRVHPCILQERPKNISFLELPPMLTKE